MFIRQLWWWGEWDPLGSAECLHPTSCVANTTKILEMASNANANSSIMDKLCPIQPIPIAGADRKPKTRREYLQYVNQTYPGGFRALRKDILNRKLETQDEDTDMADAEKDEGKPEPDKNPIDVYRDVCAQVE
jgi:hypothetical protein